MEPRPQAIFLSEDMIAGLIWGEVKSFVSPEQEQANKASNAVKLSDLEKRQK